MKFSSSTKDSNMGWEERFDEFYEKELTCDCDQLYPDNKRAAIYSIKSFISSELKKQEQELRIGLVADTLKEHKEYTKKVEKLFEDTLKKQREEIKEWAYNHIHEQNNGIVTVNLDDLIEFLGKN